MRGKENSPVAVGAGMLADTDPLVIITGKANPIIASGCGNSEL